MKIIRIFGPDKGPQEGEGLWSVEYPGERSNALEALFDLWRDPRYVYAFCVEQLSDIRKKFGHPIDAETAANELMDEADELLELLVRLAKREPSSGMLQYAFRPLNDFETNMTVLQLSKASAKAKNHRDPKLRIYAVRMGENSYVVTGGAIKLTNRMEDRPHTERQLARLKLVRDWLNREGIYYPEDLNELP
jgi:hypothetical protein